MEVSTESTKPMVSKQTTSNEPKKATKRIHFEDKGQDFLYWDIDDVGEVVDCMPMHRAVWLGVFVQLEYLKEGRKLGYVNPRHNAGYGEIKYKVVKIEDLRDEDEA